MVDWQRALGGVRDGVTGVGPGDPMEWLPLDLVTRVHPLTLSMRRRFDGSEPSREMSRTGQWVDVPRDQLLAEVRRYGGYLAFDDRTFAIESARIHCLELRPDTLSHPILTKADIETRLGAPSAVTITGTARILRYYYAEMSLTLHWHPEGRLDRITIGSTEPLQRRLTRVSVLQNWLLTADCLKDGEPALDAPRSTKIEFRRLTALLRAFGLGSAKAFSEGLFVQQPLERYALSLAALRNTSTFLDYRDSPGVIEDELRHLFWRLLHYRRVAIQLGEAARYEEAGPPGSLAVIKLTRESNRHVAGAMVDIDDLLLEMISPSDDTFSEAELISRWDYVPDNELHEALCDEW